MKPSIYLIAVFSLTGCMAAVFGTADQLNQLSVGMTKEEVLKRLGPPKSTAAAGGIEYLQYRWVKTVIAADGNFPDDYYVGIKNGRVDSYGRKGDFDTTALPKQRIEIDQTVRQPDASKPTKDLYVELRKLQDLKEAGILTAEEFTARKKKLLAEQ
jgi:Short C-terminal domain/SmpA / OmlA family